MKNNILGISTLRLKLKLGNSHKTILLVEQQKKRNTTVSPYEKPPIIYKKNNIT